MNTDPRVVSGSFSAAIPNMQIAWDSTSLGTLKECPRKYYYSIVLGYMGAGASLHLRYGILYHRALEVYDHKRAEGMSHDEALLFSLRDLAEGCLDQIACDCFGPGWTDESTTTVCPKCNGDGERKVWWNPNEGLSEKKAQENAKTLPNLFRTVVWYLERFPQETDPLRTVILSNGKPAVELSFRFELGETNSAGEQLIYCGHLDRLAEYNGQDWVVDRKTTGGTISGHSAQGYFAKYSPDNQMSGYTFGGRVTLKRPVAGVIIDAAQIAKGFSRFERGFVMRTDDQLEEWRKDALHYINLAELYAIRGYWPMNDKSCHNYGGCAFRGICSKDPKVRDHYLTRNQHMERRLWDPLQTRGDI